MASLPTVAHSWPMHGHNKRSVTAYLKSEKERAFFLQMSHIKVE